MDDTRYKLLHASGCLLCTIMTGKSAFETDSGGSEYIGGILTGPLHARLSNGADLFLVALIFTFFYLRTAAIIALLASVMSLPWVCLFCNHGPAALRVQAKLVLSNVERPVVVEVRAEV